MRSSLITLLGVIVLAGPARAQGDAKAIITKAIQAHGGADNLNKYKAARIKSKGTLSLMGNDLELTSQAVFSIPDKIKTELDLDFGGQKFHVVQVINGDKATLVANEMKQQLEGPALEEAKQAVHMLNLFQLTPLLDEKTYTLKALGEKTVEGQTVVAVQVSSKGYKDVKLYFDPKTGLLAGDERAGLEPGPAMTEAVRVELLSNYKEFDGIKQHTKTVVLFGGKKFLDIEVTDYKHLDKVDDKTFVLDD
jgi:hypothetical protein